jgi:hypothetical protein
VKGEGRREKGEGRRVSFETACGLLRMSGG